MVFQTFPKTAQNLPKQPKYLTWQIFIFMIDTRMDKLHFCDFLYEVKIFSKLLSFTRPIGTYFQIMKMLYFATKILKLPIEHQIRIVECRFNIYTWKVVFITKRDINMYFNDKPYFQITRVVSITYVVACVASFQFLH
jgi:hypothetical protein